MGPGQLAQYSAKAIAGAVVVLLVALLRARFPDVADGTVQEALRTLVEVVLTAGVVWLVPNSPAQGGSRSPEEKKEKGDGE